MKGKKSDTNFIAEFVLSCAKQGILSPEEITKKAETEINAIDDSLRKIIDLKKRRSKLIDVVSSFSKKTKDKSEEQQTLEFYRIKDLKLAASLCEAVPSVNDGEFLGELSKEALFIAKELINLKVLQLFGNKLVRAERYKQFIDFTKTKNVRK